MKETRGLAKRGMPSALEDRTARAMRESYNKALRNPPIVPWEISAAREEWLGCARAAIKEIAEELEGMAASAPNHGYINAESYHKAYEQGIREAIAHLLS